MMACNPFDTPNYWKFFADNAGGGNYWTRFDGPMEFRIRILDWIQ